jgi:hypothetical protein
MKRARGILRPLLTRTLAWSVVLLAGCPRGAGAYDPLSWYTVDAGGAIGTVSGSYLLSDTIGQHDAGTLSGGTYVLRGGFWRGGLPPSTGVGSDGERPVAFSFRSPVPNPVRTQARISFDLPTRAKAQLRVFDVSGRAVRTMDFGELPAGRHDQLWNAYDDAGTPLPGGVYFMRLQANEHRALKRILVLR